MAGMQRETTNEEQLGSYTFTVIVDDDVAAYFEQAGITDPNQYMNELLQAEKNRQQQKGQAAKSSGERTVDAILASTPDASGYPEIQEHFRGGGT
ncbi:MAG: hypothetical protein K0Q50_1780 [Vampirovibrio sp.]|jgi:hypothetical protein|nr:hypothetical protein [Vampirovibrio sp.]